MKTVIILFALAASIPAYASTASANAGHHGGGNSGAMGAAAGAFGGSSAGSSAAGASGMGGSYWSPDPRADLIDAYQPWSEASMRQYQKP